MRRLYLQFYLTIVAILVIFVVAVGVLWRLSTDESRYEETFAFAGELATSALPPADAPRARQQAALDAMHARLRADLALYAPGGALVAAAGRPMPPVSALPPHSGWLRGGPSGPTWLLRLDDGRALVVRLARGPFRPGAWLLMALAAIGLAVAIGAYPVARRLTRRLERLKAGVEQLGHGDLAARVRIEGKDEVAALAESFNRSAGRIEDLVRSHRMLLANCSHELRTPLTRIAMALALAGDGLDPRRRAELKADIAELDQLIEEILLASRLDAIRAPERSEDIDLLALAAEEAARDGIGVEGEPVFVRGDRMLLRRMIRNLIDNARRHGGDAAPEVRVRREADGRASVEVRDRGPGIAERERDRIFEPFYRPAGSAESGRGSGLGLALVRQIARHHGGDVACRAAEGGGSCFTIVLPAVDASRPHAIASPASMRTGA
jgi:two-component system, OmpR family, sensor histidine kinase RstB